MGSSFPIRAMLPFYFKESMMNDKRYSIELEFCGYSTPRYVVRFCGKWIDQSVSKQTAIAAAVDHNINRLA